jgi:hypothetical protein
MSSHGGTGQTVNENLIGDEGAPAASPGLGRPQAACGRGVENVPHLPSAMGYCAKRMLEAMGGMSDAGAQAAWEALTPNTRDLLDWWFGHEACRRQHHFHLGQREAIVHTILAYELFDSDDPHVLFGAACSAWPGTRRTTLSHPMASQGMAPHPAATYTMSPPQPTTATAIKTYRLRMAPGSGIRWVLQALVVWRWANNEALRTNPSAEATRDPWFGLQFGLLTPNRALAQGLHTAWFGSCSRDRPERNLLGNILRHTDVFLPPHLREAFAQWLAAQLRHAGANSVEPERPFDTPSIFGGAVAATASLRIEIDTGDETQPARTAVLCDVLLHRAARIGAVKSLVLLDAGVAPRAARRDDCTHTKPRRRGARPVLPRRERPLLEAGLRLLDRIERETRDLRAYAGREAPALLVLCTDTTLCHAAAGYARRRGVARETIALCAAGDLSRQFHARLVIDTLPSQHAVMQSRFSAVVLLGNPHSEMLGMDDVHSDEDGFSDAALAAYLWPALAPDWREPAFVATKTENRERIGAGRMPQTLIDVLAVIAAPWSRQQASSKPRGQTWLQGQIDALPASAGDLFIAQRRQQAQELDIVLPDPADGARKASLRWYSQQLPRPLNARQSLPVRKCVQTHQGWPAQSSGLERGLIEMAEADPHIAAFCLFDPLHQPWPGETRIDGATPPCNEQLDAACDAPPICPHALVRTPGYVYVVSFVPYLPEIAFVPSSPPSTIAASSGRVGHDSVEAWCKRVNALPSDRRQFREWRAAQVQAPLFWSWKRRGGSLSSLLCALAETAPFHARRARAGSSRPF